MNAALFKFSRKKPQQDAKEAGLESAVNESSFKPKNKKVWKSFLKGVFSGIEKADKVDSAFFTELEETLIESDAGFRFSNELLQQLRRRLGEEKIVLKTEALRLLKNMLQNELLEKKFTFPEKKLSCLFFIGVNGAGKTSTIAKLAYYWKMQNIQCILGAADTFRAAASEQLQYWSKKVHVPIIHKPQGSDSASVVYDSLQSSLASLAKNPSQRTALLIDTSGRLQNKQSLMEELKKMLRVAGKFQDKIEIYKVLVIDSSLGQNSFVQAKVFHEHLNIDGIVLSKMDTSSRGGTVFAISSEIKIPLMFISYGESLEHLSPFSSQDFVNALF